MTLAQTYRNILILAVCGGLNMIAMSTLIVENALVGHLLAPHEGLATLPIAIQQLAAMATTIPASLLMRRIGRKLGFSIGAVIASCGMVVCVLGVLIASFALFCLGTAMVGVSSGFALYYRFAAADGAVPEWRSRAISLVLAGGVIAALIGPELAKHTKDLLAVEFAGSFLVLVLIGIASLVLLQWLDIPVPSGEERHGVQRPMAEIMREPAFIVAVIAGMVGYGGMAFVMSATPLAMLHHDHGFSAAAFVIQWHVFAMFAPSFVTGHVIHRLGVLPVMIAGAVLLALCVVVNLSGTGLWQFWSALVLLGLGWNFLYVGSSTLLGAAHRPAEKAKTQAANDFLVFGTVSLGAFSSGAILHWAGWEWINVGLLPFLALTLAASLWLWVRAPKPA